MPLLRGDGESRRAGDRIAAVPPHHLIHAGSAFQQSLDTGDETALRRCVEGSLRILGVAGVGGDAAREKLAQARLIPAGSGVQQSAGILRRCSLLLLRLGRGGERHSGLSLPGRGLGGGLGRGGCKAGGGEQAQQAGG